MPRPAAGSRTGRTARLGRPQLSEEVASYLRDEIMSGRIRPGEFIRLEEVAAELGVSITPVREALLTLRGEDMVELEPRRGYLVAPLSRRDIADLFRLQADIAAELAIRAASKVTPAEVDDLRAQHEDIVAAVAENNPAEIERREFDFHRSLNRVAESRKLSWFLYAATRYTPARLYSVDDGWRNGMIADHEELLTALGARDADAAKQVMARHFTDGADRLIAHLEEQGMWSDEPAADSSAAAG